MSESQSAEILRHLQRGRSISPLEALRKFGSLRLGARIWDLKQEGHDIVRQWETDGEKRYARYSLARSRRVEPRP